MAAHAIFRPGRTFLHRANPLTKLAAVLATVALAFALPPLWSWTLVSALLAGGVALGFGSTLLKRFLVFSLPFSLAVFVFHGLVLDRPDFRPSALSLLAYSPTGLAYAALVGGRVALMLSASLLFVSTTHPADLLRALDVARLPPGVSFLLASPLLLLEQFSTRASAIRDAQQARGLAVDGSFSKRLRALRVLVVPLVTLALADAHERSGALSARGFRALPFRTVAHPPPDSPFQRALRWALLVASLALFGVSLLP
ncbi:MAG: hypothetical protein DI629_18735 [Mesorhizobium amorphae]|nr:MAG: hypothetical protein DI629_18735 [Mesorhizobium amorphae]